MRVATHGDTLAISRNRCTATFAWGFYRPTTGNCHVYCLRRSQDLTVVVFNSFESRS